jgi:hypothetical protein
MREVATTEKTQPPPPHIVWQALADPAIAGPRMWLRIGRGERRPEVVQSRAPDLVVWSSLWVDRPKDRIRFEIASDGLSGSTLRWTLLAGEDGPPAERIAEMRYRLNQLINAELRYSFGQ